MNINKQLKTVIDRGRYVVLTTKDGSSAVVKIVKMDRRHFETEDGGKFDKTDVKSISEMRG